ncbi:uncharacterized protein LOC100452318 [Pongo abelii]|uniref:uncharacterized protein LOC100452318 n=1 Tax=Pongo abelii TaxID=9601 RepID=UPI003007532C
MAAGASERSRRARPSSCLEQGYPGARAPPQLLGGLRGLRGPQAPCFPRPLLPGFPVLPPPLRSGGEGPRRLRSGGGRAARVALRAALALSAPLLNNSWRGRRPLACTGRAARLCQAAAAFGARAAPDERPRGGRAHAVPVPARPVAPIVPRPSPPVCPQARLQPTDGPALQVLARDARPGMHVNLEKVAGRAGRALRGRAWASPGRRAFVFVWDKGPLRRADAVTGSCGPLSGAVGSLSAGKPEPEGKERRGAGPGKWGLGPALLQRQSRAVPPCEELRELAPLCRPPLRRGKRHFPRTPGLAVGPSPSTTWLLAALPPVPGWPRPSRAHWTEGRRRPETRGPVAHGWGWHRAACWPAGPALLPHPGDRPGPGTSFSLPGFGEGASILRHLGTWPRPKALLETSGAHRGLGKTLRDLTAQVFHPWPPPPVTPEAQGTVSTLRPCPWLWIGGPHQRPGLSPQVAVGRFLVGGDPSPDTCRAPSQGLEAWEGLWTPPYTPPRLLSLWFLDRTFCHHETKFAQALPSPWGNPAGHGKEECCPPACPDRSRPTCQARPASSWGTREPQASQQEKPPAAEGLVPGGELLLGGVTTGWGSGWGIFNDVVASGHRPPPPPILSCPPCLVTQTVV